MDDSECIICLEEQRDSKNLVRIPCHCVAYIHPECFKKLEENKCIICRQEYKYREENKILKKESIDEIRNNRTNNLQYILSIVSSKLNYLKQKLINFSSIVFNFIENIIKFLIVFILVLFMLYIIGTIFQLLLGAKLNHKGIEIPFTILCGFVVWIIGVNILQMKH